MTTGWPSSSFKRSAMMRAVTSRPPPAGKWDHQRHRLGREVGGEGRSTAQSDEQPRHQALGESAVCGSWCLHSVVSCGFKGQRAGLLPAMVMRVMKRCWARVVGNRAVHGAAVVPHEDLVVAPSARGR